MKTAQMIIKTTRELLKDKMDFLVQKRTDLSNNIIGKAYDNFIIHTEECLHTVSQDCEEDYWRHYFRDTLRLWTSKGIGMVSVSALWDALNEEDWHEQLKDVPSHPEIRSRAELNPQEAEWKPVWSGKCTCEYGGTDDELPKIKREIADTKKTILQGTIPLIKDLEQTKENLRMAERALERREEVRRALTNRLRRETVELAGLMVDNFSLNQHVAELQAQVKELAHGPKDDKESDEALP